MPRSKASKGQLRRQANARISKSPLQALCLPITESKQSSSSAVQPGLDKAMDASEEDEITFLHHSTDLRGQSPPTFDFSQSAIPVVQQGLDEEIEAYQEDELEFINQSNDIVLYIEKETADSSDEEKMWRLPDGDFVASLSH